MSRGNISEFRESCSHGTSEFPMKIYTNNFDWYTNRIIEWHWHPELEFAVVHSGKVICFVNDSCFEVSEGEGFFINSNMMHMECPADEGESPIMTTVCFLPSFIGDCGSDMIFRKYVRPIIKDTSLKAVKLTSESEWQRKVLGIIREMNTFSDTLSFGFELKCRNTIAELWYLMAVNLLNANQGTAKTPPKYTGIAEIRLKKMLSFIHENYSRELDVELISGAANISKSECFRCFRIIIGKKPISYLNEYRLKKSAELLVDSDLSVTEICISCGFNHISYFGKMFQRYYGMSPKQFRRRNRDLQPTGLKDNLTSGNLIKEQTI